MHAKKNTLDLQKYKQYEEYVQELRCTVFSVSSTLTHPSDADLLSALTGH